MRPLLARVLAALLLAALFAGLALAADPTPRRVRAAAKVQAAAAPVRPLKTLSWNMCGAKCSPRGATYPRVPRIARQVRAWNADALFLQEVCFSQWAALKRALPGYSGGFKRTVYARGCGRDRRFGSAVLVRGKSVNYRAWNIGGTRGLSGVPFYLLAVDAWHHGRRYTAAVAHLRVTCDRGYSRARCLTLTRAGRAVQTAAIRARLAPLVRADRPVVLGGDFNARPRTPEMRAIYGPRAGGRGLFYEASVGEVSTICSGAKKIDYVLYSAHFTRHYISVSRCTPYVRSDHRFVRAWAYWR